MPKNKVIMYVIKSIQERIKIILVYLKFGQKISFNQDIKDSFLISLGDFPEDILPIPILFETFSESGFCTEHRVRGCEPHFVL